MVRDHANPEQMCVSQPKLTHFISAFARWIHGWISRAVSFVPNWNTESPSWSVPGESHSRQTSSRYEIYTEDIGPRGLKNIQILLDRRKDRLPGSTLHADLIGRDRGIAEASLKIDIVTKDEEAVLELAAEIRRSNGQSWVGVYVTAGTFIDIFGPREQITELRDDPTSDNAGDGRVDEMQRNESDLESSRI